ncbi:ribosomal protein S18-alanine N-acetyltransferase [Aerococcaceae bacterium DSM 111020]|nr:ribosomal protein S18-alanine N-acetyltransferase [Aerococcaceae bacterium DSM 111020]
MQEITFNWSKGYDLSSHEQRKIARMNTAFRWTWKMSDNDFKFDFTYYFLMYHQMKIIGYVGLHYIIDEFQINTVYVDPLYRRKGFGKKMLKQLIHLSKTKKIRHILLEVRSQNMSANKLYQAVGFNKIACRHNYYHHPKDDAYILEYNVQKEGVINDTDTFH